MWNRQVAVRLAGGIGDHILGMRVLHFISAQREGSEIVAYSDAGGATAQAEVAAMSPFVSRVVRTRRIPSLMPTDTSDGLEMVQPDDLGQMLSSEELFDTRADPYFTWASERLNVPFVDILAHRPELTIPPHLDGKAPGLEQLETRALVGMQLSKYGPDMLRRHGHMISKMICSLTEEQRVVVLCFSSPSYGYLDASEQRRAQRVAMLQAECAVIEGLVRLSPRVVCCTDLPLPTVAALLKRCSYFIGVDNGIKHLAWAIGVPLTYFLPFVPSPYHTFRWLPDRHRMLLFDCSPKDLSRHIDDARNAIDYGLAKRDVAYSTPPTSPD